MYELHQSARGPPSRAARRRWARALDGGLYNGLGRRCLLYTVGGGLLLTLWVWRSGQLVLACPAGWDRRVDERGWSCKAVSGSTDCVHVILQADAGTVVLCVTVCDRFGQSGDANLSEAVVYVQGASAKCVGP